MLWFIIVLALMIPLLAVILDSQLGRALAGRIEQDRRLGGDDAMARRVSQLESEIERLNAELTRLDEETAFLHRLLEGKSAAPELPPGEQNR